jgi:hypothetical protein
MPDSNTTSTSLRISHRCGICPCASTIASPITHSTIIAGVVTLRLQLRTNAASARRGAFLPTACAHQAAAVAMTKIPPIQIIAAMICSALSHECTFMK